MPRLHHSEITDLIEEDQTCDGCMLDRLDCVCYVGVEDSYLFPDYEEDVPDFSDNHYEHEDLSYLDMAWYESDRYPHDDDYITMQS